MKSIFNPGPVNIYDFGVAGSATVTLLDNQQVDVPDNIAKELLSAYPFLQVTNGWQENVAEAIPSSIEIAKQFEQTIAPEEKQEYICANCERHFDSHKGYRIHLKSHEKETT